MAHDVVSVVRLAVHIHRLITVRGRRFPAEAMDVDGDSRARIMKQTADTQCELLEAQYKCLQLEASLLELKNQLDALELEELEAELQVAELSLQPVQLPGAAKQKGLPEALFPQFEMCTVVRAKVARIQRVVSLRSQVDMCLPPVDELAIKVRCALVRRSVGFARRCKSLTAVFVCGRQAPGVEWCTCTCTERDFSD